MARAVNVLLDVGDKRYDINQMGLINMEFNRILSPEDISSGVLSDLTMTLFDKTGYELLSILQASQSNIILSYGFEDALSDKYSLDLLKFNTTYNNLGAMVSVGAIGSQINRKFPSEFYPPGTKIRDILVKMAKRNRWYIGPEGSREYIDINLLLDRPLFKGPDETDIQFIKSKIEPLAHLSVIDTGNATRSNFWDFKLTQIDGELAFFFRPYSYRGTERRVWKYTYGDTSNNAIISLTNRIDFSFLVQGLSIRVPITAPDFVTQTEEELEQNIQSIIQDKLEDIEQFIRDNNLPEVSPANFRWNVEVYKTEDLGNSTVEDIVLDEIQKVINAISTIELEVIGNPKIMPTDLIELVVKNKYGDLNIVSSTASTGSYWRVVTIKEKIGMSGFSTSMQLVREVTNFI